MKLENLDLTNLKNGKYRKITYKSEKVLKRKGVTITKITSGVYRFGCGYGNVVKKEFDTTNDLKANSKPFGEFLEGYHNLVSQKDEKQYLWVFNSKNRKHRPHTTYLLNGEETTKEYLIENGYLDNKPKSFTPMFVINLENLLEW